MVNVPGQQQQGAEGEHRPVLHCLCAGVQQELPVAHRCCQARHVQRVAGCTCLSARRPGSTWMRPHKMSPHTGESVRAKACKGGMAHARRHEGQRLVDWSPVLQEL